MAGRGRTAHREHSACVGGGRRREGGGREEEGGIQDRSLVFIVLILALPLSRESRKCNQLVDGRSP